MSRLVKSETRSSSAVRFLMKFLTPHSTNSTFNWLSFCRFLQAEDKTENDETHLVVDIFCDAHLLAGFEPSSRDPHIPTGSTFGFGFSGQRPHSAPMRSSQR